MMRINIIGPNSKKFSLGGIEFAPKRLREELIKQGHEVDLNGKEPIESYDIFDIHYGFSFRLLRKVKQKTTAVVHAHAQPADMHGGIFGFNSYEKIVSPFFRSYYNRAPSIITVSKYAVECLRDLGVDKPVIKPISNGIPLNDFPFGTEEDRIKSKKVLQRDHDIGDDKPIVGGIGSIFPRKGVQDMVQIAREMPDIEFIWVGKAQLTYPKRIMMRKLGKLPSNFHLIGYIDKVLDFYHGIDLMMVPAYIEMQGLTTLEAAASGTPMLLRDIPVYDWLIDGKNCIKVQDNDGFRKQIQDLLGQDLSHLTRQAREDVKIHDISDIAKKIVNHYQMAIDGKFA